MTEYLRDAGYDVVDVENGQVAVELLRDPPRQFSILVTDFHMPGDVDGSQVAQHVRTIFPDIPVIIASGRPEALRPEWRKNLGYVLLKKPYMPSDLVRIVASMVPPPAS